LAEEGTGHEELVRLLLEYRQRHGEGDGWLLLALALVALDRMVRLVEQRAASGAPAGKEGSSGKGLADLLSAFGPLMSSFKPAPRPDPATSPPAEPGPPPPVPDDPPASPRPPRNEVIKWDPRLVGGARK